MHSTSGRGLLGLVLSFLSVLLWGFMPVALTIALQAVDVYTVIWFRFLVSFCLLAMFLCIRGELPKLKKMPSSTWLLLAIASLSYISYQFLYIHGLALTSSGNAQFLHNLSYPLLGLGGLVIFRERYTPIQWLGLGVLTCGYILFFHDKLTNLIAVQGIYILGSFLIGVSAALWTVHALVQKQLLTSLSSSSILLTFYGLSALLFTPVAKLETIFSLSGFYFLSLVVCALNTIIPNGTFAESLEHLEASKVSAILALTPIATVIFIEFMWLILPGFIPRENLTSMGIFGGCLVVTGSVMTALKKSD